MDDPVIEQVKREVAERFDVPLAYLQVFLDLEETRVHGLPTDAQLQRAIMWNGGARLVRQRAPRPTASNRTRRSSEGISKYQKTHNQGSL